MGGRLRMHRGLTQRCVALIAQLAGPESSYFLFFFFFCFSVNRREAVSREGVQEACAAPAARTLSMKTRCRSFG